MKTCLQCQAQYTVVKGQRHRCEYAKCPACDDWVSIHDHKCYIQPVVEEENESEEDGEGSLEMPRPLIVYAHFEAECRGHLRSQFVC